MRGATTSGPWDGDRLARHDMLAWFQRDRRSHQPAAELVGIEVEVGVVDPANGRTTPYEGRSGVRALLDLVARELGGERVFDGDYLTAVQLADGTEISIEPGGALEYASPPVQSLDRLFSQLHERFQLLADLASRTGAALLPGATLPFNTLGDVSMVPKPRVAALSEYFARLGDAGSGGPAVMTLTLSTQTTLDYSDEMDMRDKLRMQMAVSPVVGALCVNSPLAAGRETGLLSQCMRYLLKNDPRRCGTLPFALGGEFGFADLVDWAAGLPMVYRLKGGAYVAAPDRPFSRVLEDGFGDGMWPTIQDWASQLSQVWPLVRLRRTLEMRVADGLAYEHIQALPALWTGLSYHPPSREAAWQLCRDRSLADHQAALKDIPAKGIRARFGGTQMVDLAAELVRLARSGLTARCEAGLEPRRILDALAPFEEVVDSGVTFAERLLERWNGEFQHRPERFVKAFRI